MMANFSRKRKLDAMDSHCVKDIFIETASDILSMQDIAPPEIYGYLKTYAKANGTSTSMIMSALLTSTATVLGASTSIQKWSHNDSHLLTANMYLIGAAFSGAGKSPAYQHGLEKPLLSVCQKNDKKLIMPAFTASAFLRLQEMNEGEGIVCHDEIYNSLMLMLRRSASGQDSSGERQCLLSAWNGGKVEMSYSSKSDVQIDRCAISIGGFTQPDRLLEIASEVLTSGDGLFERMLLWCLPGAARRVKAAKKAKTNLEEEFKDLCDLGHVMDLIYDLAHMEQKLVFRFSKDAESLLCKWDTGANKSVEENNIIEADSDSEDEEDQAVEPIHTPSGSKLVDHIAKVATNMHVLFSAMNSCLDKKAGQLNVSTEISKQTVIWAHKLVMHIQRQMSTLQKFVTGPAPQKSHVDNNANVPSTSSSKSSGSQLKNHNLKKILVTPGLAVTSRMATRACRLPSRDAIELFEVAATKQLGTIIQQKNYYIFFKALPTQQTTQDSLRELGILTNNYRKSLLVPMPPQTLTEEQLWELHPQRDAAKEFLKESNTA